MSDEKTSRRKSDRACGAARNIIAEWGRVLMWLVTALAAAWLESHAAQAQPDFQRGIGVSHIMAWAPFEPGPSKSFVFPPFSYPEAAFEQELKELRRIGFDFVRFAVDPGPFLQWQGSRRDFLERMLIDRIRLILSCDLAVIVEFHPSDMHPDYRDVKIAAGRDSALFKEYLGLLSRTAQLLGRLHSSRVGLEIMNEPPPNAGTWRPMLDAAYAAVREAAPTLTVVLDGGEGGNLEGTITLDGYRDDPNVLFSFHYYRPWQFTHQGMAGMDGQFLTDVPYPARARPVSDSIERTAATIAKADLPAPQKRETTWKARSALERYHASSFDRSEIAKDFDKVAKWARDHSVPARRILLGEFGAMNNEQRGLPTRQAERMRWFSDVRQEAEAHGFAWATWVHSGSVGFSLVRHAGSAELDANTLRALGLK